MPLTDEEIRENDKNNFYIKLLKLGWHFGFIPATNSVRKVKVQQLLSRIVPQMLQQI